MAGGGVRTLEETPTWAVAVVCFLLVVVSIFIEHIIHLVGQWFKRRHKRALYEALEKIKGELMLMGFISLLLTITQGPISEICIPKSVANTWHPCRSEEKAAENTRRKLLWSTGNTRRILAGGSSSSDKCTEQGKVSFISYDGIYQLHIFIFVLALFHVLYCISTMALGRAKVLQHLKNEHLKSWERETRTAEYQFSHDPERFRFARETTFGRRHLNYWSRSTVTLWIVCFFRQFVRSVPKVDYLTLRHGFIMAHLAPHSSSKFDFHKYIKRSLEEDFKVVVRISPLIWFFAILFLLSNTHGIYSYLWLPFIPLIIILLVGTKLQVIITKMGLEIQDRRDVVKGVPVVQPTDNHFWFNRPCLLLLLIHFVLFQNAFQLAFLAWTWYEFGLRSCFHQRLEDFIIRISMGVLIQFLCSYVTLPLYALVTQMGSNMKSTIFDERVAAALSKWHNTAKKHIKENKRSGATTPASSPSRPTTLASGNSPVHFVRGHDQSELDSRLTSPPPAFYHSDNEHYWVEGPEGSLSTVHPNVEDHLEARRHQRKESTDSEWEVELPETSAASAHQHEVNMEKPFSFV